MEVGESVDQTAAREVLEETGLIVRATRAIGFYSVPGEQALSLTFAGEVIGGELLPSTEETRASAYFPFDQLPELMRPYHRERVSDFASRLATPIFRTQ